SLRSELSSFATPWLAKRVFAFPQLTQWAIFFRHSAAWKRDRVPVSRSLHGAPLRGCVAEHIRPTSPRSQIKRRATRVALLRFASLVRRRTSSPQLEVS